MNGSAAWNSRSAVNRSAFHRTRAFPPWRRHTVAPRPRGRRTRVRCLLPRKPGRIGINPPTPPSYHLDVQFPATRRSLTLTKKTLGINPTNRQGHLCTIQAWAAILCASPEPRDGLSATPVQMRPVRLAVLQRLHMHRTPQRTPRTSPQSPFVPHAVSSQYRG